MQDGQNLIDMKELMEIMDDDNELIKECFDDFLADYSGILEDIKGAVDAGDASLLNSKAHKLKGSLRYLAAEPVAEIAYELEVKGQNNNLEGAEEAFLNLKHKCNQLKEIMSNY